MAIIVDKEQKRKDIALSCKKLFIQNGIKNITISKIAKTAGIGKGSLYDYFKNKEDVVFEIVNILMHKHNEIKEREISQTNSTKEKIKIFFKFFYSDEDAELRELYKEFISISLTNPNEKMIEFQSGCFEDYHSWFENIIQRGIDREEIKPIALKLITGLFSAGEGIFIASSATNVIDDVKKEIDNYIDTIFELIEVKK